MNRATRPPWGKRKQASILFGMSFAVLSIISVLSLIDVTGDGGSAGLVRAVLPVVFAAASSVSFLVGGYAVYALIGGLGSIVFYMAVLFLATLLWGP